MHESPRVGKVDRVGDEGAAFHLERLLDGGVATSDDGEGRAAKNVRLNRAQTKRQCRLTYPSFTLGRTRSISSESSAKAREMSSSSIADDIWLSEFMRSST